jgi:hypothetical protein
MGSQLTFSGHPHKDFAVGILTRPNPGRLWARQCVSRQSTRLPFTRRLFKKARPRRRSLFAAHGPRWVVGHVDPVYFRGLVGHLLAGALL